MTSSIKIRNLNHFYGEKNLKKQVLFNINLEIKAGEIVIMTGPSGSGKTTLLSLIGGLRSLQKSIAVVIWTERQKLVLYLNANPLVSQQPFYWYLKIWKS